MQEIIAKESPNAVNLLSIGGATVHAISDVNKVIFNVSSQIDAYNAVLGKKITGVDLDLENGIDSETINSLAAGFKAKGLFVSIAPQVYTSGGDIDVNNPVNLVLTSGGNLVNSNVYGKAIASGNVDYIMVQAYNSGGFTVGGYKENNVEFFKAVAQALNNKAGIPLNTKILIGEVANQGAGGQYTIFNPNAAWPLPVGYDQTAILNKLSSDISSMDKSSNFEKISGVMVWSLNNDYMPNGWGDTYAVPGAFCSKIFCAQPIEQAYFILQATNTGTEGGNNKNASITLIVDGQYYAFGCGSQNATIPINAYQCWGTLASSKQQPGIVLNSANLDNIFAGGKKGFTARIIGNIYNDWQTPIGKPDKQIVLENSYKFDAGCSYNIMFNPGTGAYQISKM